MIYKNVISFILSLALWNNAIATEFTNTEFINGSQQIEIIKRAESVKTFNMLISQIESVDKKKGHELKEYLVENPILTNMVPPELSSQKNGQFSLKISNHDFLLSINVDGSFILKSKNKVVHFNYSMPVKQIMQKLTDKNFTQFHNSHKNTNILSLFISEAHANLGLAAYLAAVITVISLFTYATYGIIQAEKFNNSTTVFHELCKRVTDSQPNGQADLKELKDAYEQLTSAKYTTVCARGDILPFQGYNALTCNNYIPRTKKCIKDKIDELEKSLINGSSRVNTPKMSTDDSSTFAPVTAPAK